MIGQNGLHREVIYPEGTGPDVFIPVVAQYLIKLANPVKLADKLPLGVQSSYDGVKVTPALLCAALSLAYHKVAVSEIRKTGSNTAYAPMIYDSRQTRILLGYWINKMDSTGDPAKLSYSLDLSNHPILISLSGDMSANMGLLKDARENHSRVSVDAQQHMHLARAIAMYFRNLKSIPEQQDNADSLIGTSYPSEMLKPLLVFNQLNAASALSDHALVNQTLHEITEKGYLKLDVADLQELGELVAESMPSQDPGQNPDQKEISSLEVKCRVLEDLMTRS